MSVEQYLKEQGTTIKSYGFYVVGEGIEKWVVQLWFRGYPKTRGMLRPVPLPGIQGEALGPSAVLPDGVKHSGELTYDNAYTVPGLTEEAQRRR